MKALVTGGAGFIGSHLAEALARNGAQITIIDDLSAGNLANLRWREGRSAVELLKGTITDVDLVRRAVQGCDWVFHHAALTSVPQSMADPVGSNAVNLDATLQLLQMSRQAGVKRFFFASSSAVYGDHPALPKREDSPLEPVSPYGLQKYAAERYAQLFHRHYGLETVCFRYFNVFGARQSFNSPYSGVIARFCAAAIARERPIVFGDGQQTRDFVYIDNVVQANLLAAAAPAEKIAGKVFNVAGGQSISLLQLLDELRNLSGAKLEPEFQPARPGDVRHSAADISAIRDAIGFEPAVSWQDGLRRTLEWYRSSAA